MLESLCCWGEWTIDLGLRYLWAESQIQVQSVQAAGHCWTCFRPEEKAAVAVQEGDWGGDRIRVIIKKTVVGMGPSRQASGSQFWRVEWFKLFVCLPIYRVCLWVCACYDIRRSEEVSPVFPLCDFQGIKLRLSGLCASTLNCWAISLKHNFKNLFWTCWFKIKCIFAIHIIETSFVFCFSV